MSEGRKLATVIDAIKCFDFSTKKTDYTVDRTYSLDVTWLYRHLEINWTKPRKDWYK